MVVFPNSKMLVNVSTVFHIDSILANGSISQYQHFVNGGILNQHSLKYQRPIWGIFALIVHIPIQMTGLCWQIVTL